MKDHETPVSEDFERAFGTNSCGCRRECFCGRVHFDTWNHWDWEKGELETLEENATKQPDKYIGEPNSISAYRLMGKEIVLGCKCNSGAPYEAFLKNHAPEIAAYLNDWSKRLQKEAEEMKVVV